MNYLYGDSSESALDFNYLAFLREALECAVVLVEHEATLGSGDRRRAKEKEAQLAVQSIEELGRHAAALFDPVVKEYGDSPVGRAAGAIVAAARDVIAGESAKVNLALGSALEAMTHEDGKLRTRSLAQLDKLLRTYDLPAAVRGYEIAWDGKAAPKKVQIAQRTPYAVDAVVEAALPPTSPFAAVELRVDKLADNVEIASVEAGGWIKKSDKLVPYKLGRYFVTRVALGRDGTQLRLRMTQDANAPGFNLTSKGIDDFALERIGDNHEKDNKARDYTIDDRNRPALRALIEKVETTARAIGAGENRALVALAIDNQPFAEHAHPQVLAERLVAAMAPTVREIAAHSSNPNELVLRRMLGDDRREEIFVSVGELVKKLDPVPDAARKVFAPLGIDRRSAPRPSRPPTQPPKLPIAGVAAVSASITEAIPHATAAAAAAAAIVEDARRQRQTAGPGNRPPPPPPHAAAPPAAASGVPITSAIASSASGQVALPGLTAPPVSSPAIAIDAAAIEEVDAADVKPGKPGTKKIAELTRAIDAALDGVPKATASASDSKRAPAVIIDDSGD